MNYYNEFDPRAVAWLKELIARNLIAPGHVDSRSIKDVTAADLRGYVQCHFFAGIGGWSRALRLVGWPDDEPVWTGSCPCQPFSAAGGRRGVFDDRHLWPIWAPLIGQLRPPVIFGEQVASKDADTWIDLVQDDLEAMGYAVGAVPFPAAGVGTPNIRDRLYWVANAGSTRHIPRALAGIYCGEEGAGPRHGESERRGADDRLAHTDSSPGAQECAVRGWRPEGSDAQPLSGSRGDGLPCGMGHADDARPQGHAGDDCPAGREGSGGSTAAAGVSGGVADSDGGHSCAEREQRGGEQRQQPPDGGAERVADAHLPVTELPSRPGPRPDEAEGAGPHDQPDGRGQLREGDAPTGPTNGYWRAADWLLCRDGKWRPVEPGTFPLAHGVSARMGRLRGYGNAINVEAAKAFIEAYLEG